MPNKKVPKLEHGTAAGVPGKGYDRQGHDASDDRTMSRRLKKELKKLKDPSNTEFADVRESCTFSQGESPLQWAVSLRGPPGSHYEGGSYSAIIEFPCMKVQPPVLPPSSTSTI